MAHAYALIAPWFGFFPAAPASGRPDAGALRAAAIVAWCTALVVLSVSQAPANSSDFDARMASAGRAYRMGNYEQAESILKDLLSEAKATGQQDLRYAEIVNNLAEVASAQGRLEEAEPLYKEAMALRLKLEGPTARDLALSVSGLADVYRLQGRYPEALQLLRRALKIAAHISDTRTMGGEFHGDERFLNNLIQNPSVVPGSPELARVLTAFGDWYREQGQYDVAIKMYKKVVDILDVPPDRDISRLYRTPWEGGYNAADGLIRLADSYAVQGQPLEGERFYKRALSYAERRFGPQHPQSVQALKKLAEFYRRQSR
ncbi:MAG TPA: tetratricopeptide repeat protein, partial [Candidatus Obscuribacterales bacterium]